MAVTRPATWLATTLLAMSLLTACGGSDGEPLVKPTTDAPSSSATAPDPDGFSPEQREVADTVVAYFSAVLDRGADPIGPAIEGLATQDLADGIVPAETKDIEDAGLQYLGSVKVTPDTVTIKGDTATVTGCLDSSGVTIVKKGETAPGVGSRTLGFSTMDITLEQVGGRWLVDSPKAEDTPSC